MPLQQINLNRQAVHVRADADEPKQLTVNGDKVYVGRAGAGPENEFRVLEDGDTITFNHGLWFASANSSKLNVVDAPLDQKVDITAPDDDSGPKKKAGVSKQRKTGSRRSVKSEAQSEAKTKVSEAPKATPKK